MYQEGPPIPSSSTLFTEQDRASAAAHARHITAGVQEGDPRGLPTQEIASELDTNNSHGETPKIFVDEFGLPFSAETQQKMRKLEKSAEAMREVKDRTVDIDVILSACTIELEPNSSKSSTDIVIRYKEVELARSYSNQVSISFVSESDIQSLRLEAVEYILRKRSQIPKAAIRHS